MEHSVEGGLVYHFDTQLMCFRELAARVRSRDEQIRFRADRTRRLSSELAHECLRFFTGTALECPGEHHGLARERSAVRDRARCWQDRSQLRFTEPLEKA